jgi:hypothetical protein
MYMLYDKKIIFSDKLHLFSNVDITILMSKIAFYAKRKTITNVKGSCPRDERGNNRWEHRRLVESTCS